MENQNNINHTPVNTKTEDSGNIRVKFLSLSWQTNDIFILELERKDLDFLPGDCISIFAQDGETSRPYSIASGNKENSLKFIIKQMDEGIVTNSLTQLKKGDEVLISRPYGWFRPGQNNENNPFIFIATGTGIAPFLSYLRSFPESPPASFYYGVRVQNDAIGFDEFRAATESVLAVSRETVPQTHRGHVTEIIAQKDFPANTHFYLCGLDAMIDDITEILENKDIDLTNIHREVFFHASS